MVRELLAPKEKISGARLIHCSRLDYSCLPQRPKLPGPRKQDSEEATCVGAFLKRLYQLQTACSHFVITGTPEGISDYSHRGWCVLEAYVESARPGAVQAKLSAARHAIHGSPTEAFLNAAAVVLIGEASPLRKPPENEEFPAHCNAQLASLEALRSTAEQSGAVVDPHVRWLLSRRPNTRSAALLDLERCIHRLNCRTPCQSSSVPAPLKSAAWDRYPRFGDTHSGAATEECRSRWLVFEESRVSGVTSADEIAARMHVKCTNGSDMGLVLDQMQLAFTTKTQSLKPIFDVVKS